MNGSASLGTGWAGTQASTSNRLSPTLHQEGAQPVTSWPLIFQEFHRRESSVRTTISQTMVRDKIRLLCESGLPGKSCLAQPRRRLEEVTESIILGPLARPFIRTCLAVRTPRFG